MISMHKHLVGIALVALAACGSGSTSTSKDAGSIATAKDAGITPDAARRRFGFGESSAGPVNAVAGTPNNVAMLTGTGTVGNAPGFSYDGSSTYTLSQNASFTATAYFKKLGYNAVNQVGTLPFQSAINSWTGIGQSTYTFVEASASDNSGNIITGIDSSLATIGDQLTICITNSPTDDGVVSLTCEDANSTANDQIKTPDCGRVSNGQRDSFRVPNDSCIDLVWLQPDQSDATNHKWLVKGASTRTARQITQLQQLFPAYDTEHLTGTINDFGGPFAGNINQAGSVPNPNNNAQSTTIAAGSNGASLPQATINVASTSTFSQSGKGSTTIAAGSNGASLPQATINVASTSGFYASNHDIFVTTAAGVQKVSCSSFTGTSFTGCTGGTGAMSTGGAVVGTYYSIAIASLANGFTEYRYVQCTGKTSTTLTGCVGGVGAMSTGGAVVNNPICEASSDCFFDSHTLVRAQTVDGTGATWTGMHYATNAYSTGLGPRKVIINYGPGPLVLKYRNSSSTSVDQFDFATGADLTIPLNGEYTFVHTTEDNYWHLDGTLPYSGSQAIQVSSANVVALNTVTACTPGSNLAGGNNNNYNPTCNESGATFSNVVNVRVTGGTSSVLTGMLAGSQGDIKTLCNFGNAFNVTDSDTNSSAANRIHTPNAETTKVPQWGCASFRYENNAFWQMQDVTPLPQVSARFTGDLSVSSPLELNISGASCTTDGQHFIQSLSATGTGTCAAISASSTGTLIGHQVFTNTAGGTYTPTSGTKKVYFRGCGQGGGGGGAQNGTGGAAGGGGGAAGIVEFYVDCAGSCTGGTWTLGNGTNGGSTSGGDGTAGGNSTISVNGTTYTFAGGNPGKGMTNVANPSQAYGATKAASSTSGGLDPRGTNGDDGIVLNAAGGCAGGISCGHGGNGGNSPWGAGGLGQNLNDAGEDNGYGFCSGGSGGATRFGTGFVGGSGSQGRIEVWEYN